MIRILLLVGFIYLMGCGQNIEEKSISLEAQFDTTTATIGDIIRSDIKVNVADHQFIMVEDFEKSPSLEIRKSTIIKEEDHYLNKFQYVFWDTGRFTIPPITISIMNSDSTLDLVMQTDPQDILIVSSADPTLAGLMKPIKDPVPISKNYQWKLIILLLILFTSLSLMVWINYRYKKEKLVKSADVIKLDPDKIALKKINALKSNQGFQSNVKELYVQISYILREYVENSLFYKTLEMSTDEIKELKSYLPFSEEEMSAWLTLLNRSDMIKYAKMIPEKKVCSDDLSTAEHFIKSTTPYWKPPLPSNA